MKKLSLSQHILESLRSLRWQIPMGFSLCMSILYFATLVWSQVDGSKQLLSSLRGHTSSLVESLDRPELQRLVSSLANGTGNQVEVIRDDVVIASSRSLDRLDRAWSLGESPESGTSLSWDGIVTAISVERENGPSNGRTFIVMVLVLHPILLRALLAAVGIFIAGFIFVRFFSYRMGQVVSKALQPVSLLQEAIQSMDQEETRQIPETPIEELESIRSVIEATHMKLIQTREALARAKAHELAGQALRRLIHDLHTPVTALRNLVRSTDREIYGEQVADEALRVIPKCAEEILNQVSSAKSNLQFEAPKIIETDLRETVENTVNELRRIEVNPTKVEISLQLPEAAQKVAHDPILIKRALGNLIRNAVEAAKSEVAVSLSTEGTKVRLKIQDDGNGMNPEDVSPYLQGRRKSTKADRIALGLSGANHVVRSQGGRIVYGKSQLGGACFEIILGGNRA